MSAYIKLSTLEYPRHIGDIWLEHPELTNQYVCPETYAIVHDVEMPRYDFKTQKIIEQHPVNIDGVWHKSWKVVNYTVQELNQIKEAELEFEKLKNDRS